MRWNLSLGGAERRSCRPPPTRVRAAAEAEDGARRRSGRSRDRVPAPAVRQRPSRCRPRGGGTGAREPTHYSRSVRCRPCGRHRRAAGVERASSMPKTNAFPPPSTRSSAKRCCAVRSGGTVGEATCEPSLVFIAAARSPAVAARRRRRVGRTGAAAARRVDNAPSDPPRWTSSFEAGGVVRARDDGRDRQPDDGADSRGPRARPAIACAAATPLVTLDSRESRRPIARAPPRHSRAPLKRRTRRSRTCAARRPPSTWRARRTTGSGRCTTSARRPRRNSTRRFRHSTPPMRSSDGPAHGWPPAARPGTPRSRRATPPPSPRSYAVLIAPFDGLVTDRSVDPGAMATPGIAAADASRTRTAFRLEVCARRSAGSERRRSAQTVDVEIGDAHRPNHWTSGHASARSLGSIRPPTAFSSKSICRPRVPSFRRLRTRPLCRVDAPDARGPGIGGRPPRSVDVRLHRGRRAPRQAPAVSPGAETRDRIEILAGYSRRRPS